MRRGLDLVFTVAVWGTLLAPFAAAAIAWQAGSGRRVRALLRWAAVWLAFCAVAGIARLAAYDGYYTPSQVTYWAHSSSGEHQVTLLLMAATALAAAAALIAWRRHVRTAVGMLVLAGGAVCNVVLVSDLILYGIH